MVSQTLINSALSSLLIYSHVIIHHIEKRKDWGRFKKISHGLWLKATLIASGNDRFAKEGKGFEDQKYGHPKQLGKWLQSSLINHYLEKGKYGKICPRVSRLVPRGSC